MPARRLREARTSSAIHHFANTMGISRAGVTQLDECQLPKPTTSPTAPLVPRQRQALSARSSSSESHPRGVSPCSTRPRSIATCVTSPLHSARPLRPPSPSDGATHARPSDWRSRTAGNTPSGGYPATRRTRAPDRVHGGAVRRRRPACRPRVGDPGERGDVAVGPWIDGTTGAAWLDDPGRARHLADRMGALVRDFDRIDPAGLPIESALGDSRHLADRGSAGGPSPCARRPPRRRVCDQRRDRAGGDAPRVVHGDFAPINVIVGADGEIAALLDFETRTPAIHTPTWPGGAGWSDIITPRRGPPPGRRSGRRQASTPG